MSDEKALLAAIWEHPHEDTPRLVYADWLDEHEQPERAEFIRVQCELARLDRWDEGRLPVLVKREKELWLKWRTRWRAHLPEERKKCDFHRGFPRFDLGGYALRDLLELTVADLELAPLSHGVYGFQGRGVLRALEWPGLRFLAYFAPSSPPKGWVKAAAACDNLRNVSALDLRGCKLSPAEIRALLDVWADRHLPTLTLDRIGNEGAAVLAAHPTVAKVRELGLDQSRLTKAGIDALCSSRYLTQAKSLDLSFNPLGDAGVETLLRWRHSSGLRELALAQTKLTGAGAAALADCPALAELRELSLTFNSIDADGCRALARSPHLGRLSGLRLYANPGTSNRAVRKELKARFGKAVTF